MSWVLVSLLCYFCAVFNGALAQSEVGDACRLQSTGRPGTCVLLSQCPAALSALQKRGEWPQTCGFQGTQPIACCADSAATVTTGTTTRRTIATRPTPTTTTRRAQTPITRQPLAPGDKAKQKCREYAEYVYITIPNPTVAADSAFIKKYDCGIIYETLIIGGTLASRKEFPHQAVIGYEGRPGDVSWECGGSLISENYVLTAGHCLYSRNSGDAKFVKMGILKLTDTRYMQIRNIIERIRQPDYRPPSHYNDIGLLKLDKNFEMTSHVRPACLFTAFRMPTEKVIATGWGKTDFTDEVGSDVLRKVTLELYDTAECNSSYKNQIGESKLSTGIEERIQICAGSHTEEKDTCQGDSGGPLQVYHIENDVKCMYDIVGVTSFGKVCGIGNHPGVYTRVSTYIKWIESIVWP